AELRDHTYPGDAPSGRVHLWVAGRSVWATHPTHDRHHFLFGHGIAHGLFSKLHLVADFSRALRNRHGWRMGTRRVAGDGNPSDRSARIVLGNFAARLRVWLSAGGGCVLDCVSVLRLARSLRRRSIAGISCALYPDAFAGIAGVVASARQDARILERCASRAKTPLGTLSL